MVVVLTGGGSSEASDAKRQTLAESFVLPAAKSTDPLPPNPEGVALLESRIRQAALPPEKEAEGKPLPDTARRISGRAYRMDRNPYAPVSLSLVFEGEREALLRLGTDLALSGSEGVELPVGPDGAHRIAPGSFGIPAALKGWWERDDLLVVKMNEVGNINHWRIEAAFRGDPVEVSMGDATGLGRARFGGRIAE